MMDMIGRQVRMDMIGRHTVRMDMIYCKDGYDRQTSKDGYDRQIYRKDGYDRQTYRKDGYDIL